MKGLDCPNCAEKIRAESEKHPLVKKAEMNFMAKKLSLDIAKESSETVFKEVAKITASLEPDVEVVLLENGAAVSASEDNDDPSDLKMSIVRIIAASVIFAAGMLLHDKFYTMWIFLASYFIVGLDVLIKAGKNILKGRPFDECFLMTLATLGAFCIGEYPEGAAVMILYQLGEMFQSYAVRRSRKSIASLMDIRPDVAFVKHDGVVEQSAPELVEVGNIIVVKPGEKIPLDCVVTSGTTSVDTSALTGESVPRQAGEGESLMGGCVNLTGVIEARVTKKFGESTVTKILELVENASAKKAKSEQFITRFARWYTPCVVIAALLLAAVPSLISGFDTKYIYSALSFLVVSCPCALVISVPLSFFGGIGGASARGILIKGGIAMEQLAECGTVVFDKTGTLTDGTFEITRIIPAENRTEKELLALAAAAEQGSNHPAAMAVMRGFEGVPEKADITEIAGRGVKAITSRGTVFAGSRKLMEENGISTLPEIESAGTLIFIAENGVYAGVIEISDSVKADAEKAVSELKKSGIKTVMLTGDRCAAAEITAKKLGLDEWRAELLPDGKVAAVEEIMKNSGKRKTIFVGDGINDAPVLMRADAGVAMGGIGSDAAIEAADAVIMNDKPSKLIEAIKISRKTKRIVIQNIVFSLAVKAAVLILAAVGIATMWSAVFADVGVCLIAVVNAMRARKI
ncbi:MAG: heavy metal translocating P-type ATPase [Oscillospiraceae bacterium]